MDYLNKRLIIILMIVGLGAYVWREKFVPGLMREGPATLSQKIRYRHCDTAVDRNNDGMVDLVTYTAPHPEWKYQPKSSHPTCISKGGTIATDTNIYTWEDSDFDGRFEKMTCQNAWKFPC